MHLKGGAINAATKMVFFGFDVQSSYWDLRLAYGPSKSTICKNVADVLSVCDDMLRFESMPKRNEICIYQQRALGFAVSRHSLNFLPGCDGRSDGTIITDKKTQQS